MNNVCKICGKPAKHSCGGQYLCSKHQSQWYRYHNFNDNTIYKPNDFVLYKDRAEIILRNLNHKETGRAIIDLEDVDRCSIIKWYLRKPTGKHDTSYVMGSIKGNGKYGKKIFLHRFIVGYFESEKEIDHINRNGLDNRKTNLRIVSHSENASNNKHNGVKQVPSGNWQASCCRNYKTIYIGTYKTQEEAAKARADFIKQYDSH